MPIRVIRIVAAQIAHSARGRRTVALSLLSLGLLVASELALAIHFGMSALLPAYVVFAVAGWVLACCDLRWHRVPNLVLAPSFAAIFGLLLAGAAVDHEWGSLGRAMIAAVAVFAVFGALALAVRHGLGLGDVKLSGLTGMTTGFVDWRATMLCIVIAFLLGGIAALPLVLRGKRNSRLPFAPFLVVGAIVGICWP